MGITFFWYQATDRTDTHSGETPLAQVGSVSDEVLRRPPTRLLWHEVNTGDPLFNGEAIRTSPAGELRIQFEDGRYIDVEPDSLIVLSQAQGEISLDLMEGSLFVNAKTEGIADTSASGLVLNSAQGKVELTGASASLSKAEGQSLNLQVVDGSAKVQSKDGKTKEITSGKAGVLGAAGLQFKASQVQILSPAPNKPFYVDPDKKPEISFNWKGFPKEWKVSVLAGSQRRKLKEVISVEPGKEDALAVLALGRHYWKLAAYDPNTGEVVAESQIYRLEVAARSTPTLIAPAQNATIELEQLPGSVVFQWQTSDKQIQNVLEVARDSSLKDKVITQNVGQEDRFDLSTLNEGTYYWRLSSFFPDTKEPWSGAIQQFKIIKKAETKPLQVDVSWDQIKSEQYFIEEPQLELSWGAGENTAQVAQWKVSWKEENNPDAQTQYLETSEKSMKAKIIRAGRFIASVEAFDNKGRSMGRSEDIPVNVTRLPALPSPQIPIDGELVSQADGHINIEWVPVEGAKNYQLIIKDTEGREILNKAYDQPQARLQNLMPGAYVVTLFTTDIHDRSSPDPTTRKLIVPPKSHLRAPAVKKVKVN